MREVLNPHSLNTRTIIQTHRYDYVNGDWSQVGNDIVGDNTDDQATRLGKISGDGTTIAHIGGNTDDSSTCYCTVRRYVPSTNTWDKIGSNIPASLNLVVTNSDGAYDSLAISQNGNVVAIGSNTDGLVRVYEYDITTDDWIQLGSDIMGENHNDEFGISLDMTDDGSVIIVGAWKNNHPNGAARVFEYYDGTWTQVGSNLIPTDTNIESRYFGRLVRVSGNGKFFVVNGYVSSRFLSIISL